MKVTTKLSKATIDKYELTGEPVTVEANIPEDLDAMVSTFGKEVVQAAAKNSFVLDVQALSRRMMQPRLDKEGKISKPASTAAEIQTAVDKWRPDVRSVVRRTDFEKAAVSVQKLSPEERKALLAQLMSQAG